MGLPLANHFVLLFVGVIIITWILCPFWIRRARQAGLLGQDIHKQEKQSVAEMGGIIVLLSFIIGIIGFIAMRVFLLRANSNIAFILAILTGILLAGIIGIIDDILGWKIGLKQWQKPLLTLLVAAPIMAVNAGTRVMSLPLIGSIDLGIVYPLFIIPGFILVGTNGFNILAGYNGLETGQGIIILSTLGYLSYLTGSGWLAVIAFCMVAALIGFLAYNAYPASIFPGDTLTYAVGALGASIAVFANLEKAFVILFIPYIAEFFLKLRGKFKKESFTQIQPDGSLILRYRKFYGLEHIAVSILNKFGKATEKRVVYLIHGIQLVFAVLAVII